MKKTTFLLLAAIAMVGCGNTYTAKQATLNTMNDSMNFALGYANGSQIKMYYLANDSSKETITEFIDALDAGYNGTVEELTEDAQIGQSIGNSIKQSEKTGLADNKAWQLNEPIFFQALVNGINEDTTVMTADFARTWFQQQYMASQTDTTIADKPVLGKCPTAVKNIPLRSHADSLNYAFGLLNGDQLRQYVLSDDSTGSRQAEVIKFINKGLKDKTHNPQLKSMGEQIGKSIKDQEPDGLINEPSLATDFALIKQGFINAMLGDESQFTFQSANEYIQNTLSTIKYGDTREQGERFLEENKLREGVITTESGLQYEVITMGKGVKPSATDRVKVHYHGTLIDGTVFDSSVDRGEPSVFGLNQVIAGWTEGVQLMPVGSKFRFFIPQELGYGSREAGAGSIPPYSTLIFEVELLGIE